MFKIWEVIFPYPSLSFFQNLVRNSDPVFSTWVYQFLVSFFRNLVCFGLKSRFILLNSVNLILKSRLLSLKSSRSFLQSCLPLLFSNRSLLILWKFLIRRLRLSKCLEFCINHIPYDLEPKSSDQKLSQN